MASTQDAVFVLWHLGPGAALGVGALCLAAQPGPGQCLLVAVPGGDGGLLPGKAPGAGGKQWWKAEALLQSD